MTGTEWSLDASDDELRVHTGVTGRAAKMGHRLTIAMTSWHATVSWAGEEPTAMELTVEVDSFQVLEGEGGLTPLSGPEKALARSNALKSLDVKRFPHLRFRSDAIEATGDGYRLSGTLEIRGRSREHVIELQVEDLGDSWRMLCESPVRQSEFGVKPYSMLMGSMKVADEVTVSFVGHRQKTSES